MRKIIHKRADVADQNKEALNRKLFFALAVLFLLACSVFFAAAADMENDVTSYAEPYNVSERPARATVSVIYGGYEYATCNSPIMKVEELLSRIGIEIEENAAMNVAPDSMIKDGLEITIGVYETEYYKEEADIPFDTVYMPSLTIPKGEKSLVEAGVPGKKTVTHEITSVDGVVVSDSVVSETIESKPVNAVYYKGVGGTVTAEDGTIYSYSYYIDVVATAYHTGGITATGHVANEEVIAVDPKLIPYGTKMFITGKWGEIGYRSAEDCGNFKGKHIDICMEGTREELLQFGRRSMRVYILE